MKRVLFSLVLAIAASGVLTPDASAQPLTGICAFPLEVTPLVDQTTVRVTLPNGTVITTGRLVYRLANADTDATIDLNISGPTFTDVHGNSTYHGSALLFFGEEGELYLTRGTVVFDSTGVASETGTRTNLCALLE